MSYNSFEVVKGINCEINRLSMFVNKGLMLSALLSIIIFSFGISAADEILIDDGLTNQERAEIYNQATSTYLDVNIQEYYPAFIIVDSTRPNAYFGMYRFSQMSDPGWDLLRQTIDWAMNYQEHSAAKICLTPYRNLESMEHEDALAVYNFLIDSMNIDSANIFFINSNSIDTADFSEYNLVLNVGYSVLVSNILSQDVPFITSRFTHIFEMGIGTIQWGVIHEDRDFVYVKDTTHDITVNYNMEELIFTDSMWMNAVYPIGNGVSLVTATDSQLVPPAKISVKHLNHVAHLGEKTHFDIHFDPVIPDFEIDGFDLLISYDPNVFTIDSITPGELLDSCGWEYFEYAAYTDEDIPYKNGLIRIVGVAEVISIPGSPLCNISSAGSLVNIDFQTTDNSFYGCGFSPIDFYWYDCGDNAVSSTDDSVTLNISNRVFDFWGNQIAQDTTFPTSQGAPDLCLTSQTIKRRIDFRSGFVQVTGCAYPEFDKGDINLNGLGYEIADAIMFKNYLIQGIDVLNIDQEEQISQSDVNLDSIPLTLDDYVYLWRVITATKNLSQNPPNKADNDTVIFVQDTLNKKVSFTYSNPEFLHAVYLVFEGDLKPWGDTTGVYFNGIHSRVLVDIWTLGDSTIFMQDSLFYYTGEGNLIGAFAASDGVNSIPTRIEGAIPGCCQNRGNVDGDALGSVNIADLVALVAYQFASGDAPPCLDEADINGDWSIDIVDIICFVDYMFRGGPPPAPCL